MAEEENKNNLNISANPVYRFVMLVSGILLTGIGILGIFLPLLPATIFFLLAAWCYARSSESFYNWLHNNKLFGKYLTNYRKEKGMNVKSKVFTIIFLWTGILYSAFYATEILYVKFLLILIAIGVTWHILAINTIKD